MVSQKSALLRLGNGQLQTADGQRVLCPYVDVSFLGAYRVSRDHHALDHLVGISLHDAPVHKRARIALVSITDNVTFFLGLSGHLGPFITGGESAASPSS